MRHGASHVGYERGRRLTRTLFSAALSAGVIAAPLGVLSAAAPVLSSVPVQLTSLQLSTQPHTPSDIFYQQSGAAALAARTGDIGRGVTVAVLDTGIDPVGALAGRVIGGVDLTGGNSPLSDQFGHGTFVAGLVAGDGAGSGGRYTGEAPGADLVSIKVGGADGKVDVTRVVEGVDWAIANRDRFGIRVLNMSLGFVPKTSTDRNVLDQAVEQAWNAGIVVVASAGNSGPKAGTVLSPGDDPRVITVGALDDRASTNPAGDEMASFSGTGPTVPDGWAKPDLVASGRSVASLGVPGSAVWNQHPSSRLAGGYFVGSGTSFSAAVTSGAVALLLSANPALTPDEVKAALVGNARTISGLGSHGALNVDAAARSVGAVSLFQVASAGQYSAPNTVGSMVWDPAMSSTGAWNAGAWNAGAWNAGAWNAGAWNAGAWNAGAWNAGAWNAGAWNAGAWNAGAWNAGAWNAGAWNAGAWNAGAWNAGAWNAGAWNAGAWNAGAWNAGAWNAGAWNAGAWNAGAWNAGAWNAGAWNAGAWNAGAWNAGAWNAGAWNAGAWNAGAWNAGAWNAGAWN